MSEGAIQTGDEAESAANARAHQLESFAALLASGRHLGTGERTHLESVLRRDLGDLVVHNSEQAGKLARRLGARAFAVGRRVFAPPSVGEGLLAHEAAHVVQQTAPTAVPRLPLALPAHGRSGSDPGERPAQLQPAGEPDGTSGREASAEWAASAVTGRRSAPARSEINLEVLTDRVYALLCEQVVLERERLAGPR